MIALVAVIIVALLVFALRKDRDTIKIKSQNDSLKTQLEDIKVSVQEMENRLKIKLDKVDSSIVISRRSISSIESNVATVRNGLTILHRSTPEEYYNSLSKKDKEKLQKLMYQDVLWE